jgi:ribosomal protein S25
LDSVIENVTITVNEIVSKTFIGKRTVQNALKKLAENNKIKALGEGRQRAYQRIFDPNDSIKK